MLLAVGAGLTRPSHHATHVYVVCSARPSVGKTLVARLCAELDRSNAPAAALFDLGTDGRKLADFLPSLTTRASIADAARQMAIFDQLASDDGTPKVVDVCSSIMGEFFAIMQNFEFATEAERRAIRTNILFIADADEASAATYARLQQEFPTFTFVPVHNEAIAHGRAIRRAFAPNKPGVLPLQIPSLASNIQTLTDRPPFSFAEFRRRPSHDWSPDMSAELTGWLKRIFRQLRELELALLIGDLRSALGAAVAAPPDESP
jgi:hypothetical protein